MKIILYQVKRKKDDFCIILKNYLRILEAILYELTTTKFKQCEGQKYLPSNLL